MSCPESLFIECAMEPQAILDSEVRNWVRWCVGEAEGCYLSKIPVAWRRMVEESMARGRVGPGVVKQAKTRIEELHSRGAFLERRGSTRGGDGTWCGTAVAEHECQPFHAIVLSAETFAAGRPSGPFVYPGDESAEPTELKAEASCRVPRTPAGIVALSGLLLDAATHIKLVDRYFTARGDRFVPVLKAVLARLVEDRHGRGTESVQIHLEDRFEKDGVPTREETISLLRERLAGCIPAGATVSFHAWPKGLMHDRFVLTHLGGLQYGHGLDQRPDSMVQVTRLNQDDRKAHWLMFSKGRPFLVLFA